MLIRANPGRMRQYSIPACLGLIVLALGRPAPADMIQLTGNVARDFPAASNPVNSFTIPGRPGSVAESPYIARNGWTTGFLIDAARFTYDKATDSLFVGIQTRSITGDADGNGDPGRTSAQMASAGGINFAHFGGDKSLTIAFANSGPGTATFVAGIPADKSLGDVRNTNEFTVATYNNDPRGLAYSYGSILDNHVGQLAVDPSASRPNFEFSLTHVSQIPGFNPSASFFVDIYLGSQRAIVVGKESLYWTQVPNLNPAPANLNNPGGPIFVPNPINPLRNPIPAASVPEPSAALLLAIGAGIAGLAHARRKRLPTPRFLA